MIQENGPFDTQHWDFVSFRFVYFEKLENKSSCSGAMKRGIMLQNNSERVDSALCWPRAKKRFSADEDRAFVLSAATDRWLV